MRKNKHIRDQLIQVFSEKQADVLTHVVTEAYDKLVTRSDLHELRDVVREMADAQKASTEQLAKTDQRVAKVDERVAKLDERLAKTDERVVKLDERLAKTNERLAKLAENTERRFAETSEQFAATNGRIDRVVACIDQLTGQVRKLAIGQDELVGPVYEGKVATHLDAYVGDTVAHCVVLDSRGKARFFAHLDPNGLLDRSEVSDLRRADILATGRIDGEAVVLVVEVSRTGDEYDITRTARRAAILAKTGTRAVPVVACLHIGPATRALARSQGVWVIRKGRLLSQAS